MGLQQPQAHHTQTQQHGSYPNSRPSSIVQTHTSHPPPSQNQTGYPSPHSVASVYPSTNASGQSDSGPIQYYQSANQSYATSQTSSPYASSEPQPDIMATQMAGRQPYSMSNYHSQGSAPSSVAPSPQPDQHRSIYGHAAPTHQPLYYGAQQYQIPSQAPSPYATSQYQGQPHSQQPMTSQPNMMMSHAAAHNPMAQHSQHPQSLATNSPRNPKMELQTHQMQQQKPGTPTAMSGAHSSGSVTPLATPTGSAPQAVNPNAAPGPIPATTPLVVRQDQNGVQWIAFEYSRDRVKMEYTIRCDVESVNTDELTQEFKTENCVYPRACCPKEQYRGNRQVYETECNTVGWALAQLNPTLRGKRGLIQRAVDSWRNSNQDPRLRSRRVRRMAKMNNRKAMQSQAQAQVQAQAAHMGAAHMSHLGKSQMALMGQPLHHQHHAPDPHQQPHHMQHHPQHPQHHQQHAHPHAAAHSASTTPTGEEMNMFSHQM